MGGGGGGGGGGDKGGGKVAMDGPTEELTVPGRVEGRLFVGTFGRNIPSSASGVTCVSCVCVLRG